MPSRAYRRVIWECPAAGHKRLTFEDHFVGAGVEAAVRRTRCPLVDRVTEVRGHRDGPLRRWTSSHRVEFEDPSTFGRCHRLVEIDTVDDADELHSEWNAACERTEHVAEVPNALRRV